MKKKKPEQKHNHENNIHNNREQHHWNVMGSKSDSSPFGSQIDQHECNVVHAMLNQLMKIMFVIVCVGMGESFACAY